MTDSPSDPKLRIINLEKRYGDFVALEGASLDLADGEFLTLLGPSGSGKTTLLLAVAGLSEPDGGEIWIDGALATYLPPYKRDLGMVFQSYALFPHLTIRDNIGFGPKMRGWSKSRIDEAVTRALDTVHLPHLADRFPRQLSGGQQQRIALARAMVYEPSVILMDEPLGALDKKLRDQMQYEIKQLHQELGIAVVYVTHDQEEALVMSDRICLMRHGGIEQIGTPADLYFRPNGLFAADFLGEANLLSGRIVEASATPVVELAEGLSIRCVGDHTFSQGDQVRVMVRPESVTLLGDGQQADNSVPARVRDVVMSGATTKIFLTASAGFDLFATVLTNNAGAHVAKGAEVSLGWSTEAAVVLPDGGE